MRQTIESYELAESTVRIEFDSGGPVGGDHLVAISGDDFQVTRWFYFDEFNEAYAKNFAEKVIDDSSYRAASLDRTADWAQIADIYEPAARRIYSIFSEAGLMGYTMGNDSERERYEEAQETMEILCEEIFQEIRGRIRESQSLDELDSFIEERVKTAEETAARLTG